MAGDKRTDSGDFYPGGTVVQKPGTAPGQTIVNWRDIVDRPDLSSYATKADVTEAVDVEQRRAKAAEEQNAEEAARAKAKADSAQGAADDANVRVTGAIRYAASAEEISREARNAAETAQNATNAHVARTDNPHGVTAAQVGSYTKAESDAKLAAKVDAANAALEEVA